MSPKHTYMAPCVSVVELRYTEQLCLTGSPKGDLPDYDIIDPGLLEFEGFNIMAW